MPDYILRYEKLFNRFLAIVSQMDEELQVAMLLASFGKQNTSPFGNVIASR